MSEVVRKRLMLAMTVSALALAVMTWGSMAPAQEATDPAEGGETAIGDEGIDTGDLPDDSAIGEQTDSGEVTVDEGWVGEDEITIDEGWVGEDEITIDEGWVGEGEVTIDDGWVEDGVISEGEVDTPPTDEGWVEDPAESYPGEEVAEDSNLVDPENGTGPTQITAFDESLMMQSGLPEVRRNLAPGAPSAAAKGALPAAREATADGEGQRPVCKDEVCVAP